MTDAEAYNKAADIVEKGWTQWAFARNEYGSPVHPCEKEADRWCLTGALVAATNSTISVMDAPTSLIKGLKLEDDQAVRWNDDPSRTQAGVVELLREAAKREETL